ncbi:hypothetical protein KFK09_024969 [Dendrobium nobile]|uniref:Uncharacterized protein n=1 Tax=Dendrobium nobile TaxID=94219 RepID=A0A8T3AE39_DENNO|nr:hypothetical protein KFK09_024969 [Dendrobium nobile]
MASMKAFFVCALLICFIILDEEFLLVAGGRYLVEQKVEGKQIVTNSIEVTVKSGGQSIDAGSMARVSLDDARPTVPGHSPGVGHEMITKESIN